MPMPLQVQFDAWTEAHAHTVHQVSLGILFVWLGGLKQFGHDTTTTLLAHTIYWGEPEVMVRVLGAWELAIGVALLIPPLHRLAVLLLLVRLPGTLLALFLLPEITFAGSPLVPTPEGQYLLKDVALFGAALVIAEASIRRQRQIAASARLRAPHPD
jgi:uncharacterized membrane protein YkgB